MFIYLRRTILLAGDWLCFYLCLACALIIRQAGLVTFDFFFQHVRIFSIIFPIWSIVFYILGLYDFRRIHNSINLLSDTILAFVINLTLSTAVFYLFSPQLGITPKTHLFLTLLFAHPGILLWRRLWIKFFSAKIFVQRVAFLGKNPIIAEIINDLKTYPHLGLHVVSMPALVENGHSENKTKYWKLNKRSKNNLHLEADILVVDADQLENDLFSGRAILSTAITDEIPIVTHLDFYEDLYGKIPPEHAAKHTWLFSHVLHKKNQFYIVVKRAMDILIAAAGLLLSTPVFLIIFLAAAFENKGTPFYIQKRWGYLGQKFIIWKFRTMVLDAEKMGPLYKISENADSRITRVGWLLRRLRLDELPQLWNVLKGDMSLVGPRPEWTREVRILEHMVPHYHLRHLVKPGITGWAQINFRATNNEADSLEKLHYDLYYVKNISLALDIRILFKTAKRIFQKEGNFSRVKVFSIVDQTIEQKNGRIQSDFDNSDTLPAAGSCGKIPALKN